MQNCASNTSASGFINSNCLPQSQATSGTLQTILTIVFAVVGALALLFMVIAGLRYIMAQGDPAKVTEAKNRILYSAIGLVLAASGALIVNFVLGNF